MTNEHTSLEKYTSHTLFERVAKGLRKGYVWELSWRLSRLQHNDPKFLCFSSTSFSFYWAAQSGVLRAQPSLGAGSHNSILSPTNWLQLTEPVCGTGLYICLTATCFLWAHICTQFNPSKVKVIPWYLRPDAPVIYLDASLIWQLGRELICNKLN